jgi:hypothetical protein
MYMAIGDSCIAYSNIIFTYYAVIRLKNYYTVIYLSKIMFLYLKYLCKTIVFI